MLVSQPQIASVQALKGKRLYLPQQDSLRSCIARGMLDQARMSLKDLGKVEFQNTRGAGLNALGLGATDATVAESSEAEKWLAANPGKGRVLLTSRETPAGLAVLSHKNVAAELQTKIARWATAPEGVLPGQPALAAASADGEQKLVYLASLGIHTPDALDGVTRVSAEDVAKLIAGNEKPALVDTRSAQEFNNETIQGAISAPYGEKSLKERLRRQARRPERHRQARQVQAHGVLLQWARVLEVVQGRRAGEEDGLCQGLLAAQRHARMARQELAGAQAGLNARRDRRDAPAVERVERTVSTWW